MKESEHFNIYYYETDDEQLLSIVEILESAYNHHSSYLHFNFKDKTTVILYRTHRDFEQTNILSGFLPPQVGGFADVLMNRLVVPIDAPYEELKPLLWHELTHIFQYHIFKSSIVSRQPPMWFMEGTAEHLSQHWDMKGIMVLRDTIMNGHFFTLSEMENFYYTPNVYQCYKESQSFIDWFVDVYGVEKLRKMIRYLKRPAQYNLNQVFKKTVDQSYKEINDRWYNYLKKKYWPKIKDSEEPNIDYGRPILSEKLGRDLWLQPVYFPSGEILAGITNKNNTLDIYFYNNKGNKIIKRLTPLSPKRYEYLIVEENSMDISPDGRKLAIFARDGKSDVLLVFNIFDGKYKKYRFNDILKPRHPCWKNGNDLFFTGEVSGGRNIFLYDFKDKPQQITFQKAFINYVNYDRSKNIVYYTKRVNRFDKIFSLSLNTNEEVQLTYRIGNDVEISLSSDGKKILFTSDRFQNIPNLYIYDIEKKATSRITSTLGGNFMAKFSPDGKEIAFTSYYNSSYKTYIKEVKDFKIYKEEIENKVPTTIEKRDYANIKFLKNIKKYKLKLRATNVSSYLTYENGVLENYSNITLSDIFGNVRVALNIDAIRQFNNFYIYAFDQTHRLNYGLAFYNQRKDYYFWDEGKTSSQGNFGGALLFLYPTSKYRRFELEVQFAKLYWGSLFRNMGFPSEKRVFSTTLNFVSDTTKPGFFTYNHGSRYILSLTRGYPLTDTYYDVYNAMVDYRRYWKLTFRGTLAWHLLGYSSFGRDKDYIYLGGIGSVRGYSPMSIYGSNAAFSSLEMRIPFIDIIRFAGLFDLYYIRGLLFMDVGDAWNDDNFHAFKKVDNNLCFDDLKGSVGFGIRFRWGYFDLMFDFAKKWNFYKVYPKTIFQFNIGTDF